MGSNFKKVMIGLSAFCSVQSLFTLMMYVFPSLVGFQESIGYLNMFLSMLLPAFSLLLWVLYASRKSVFDKNICITATAFLGVHALLTANNFLDFVPAGFIGLIAQSALAIFANVLCIIFATMKKD